MYESFGVSVENGRPTFRLFLPDNRVDGSQYVRGGSPQIAEVRAVGDFQGQDIATAPRLEPTEHESGTLWIGQGDELPEGYYTYKYFVTFENQTTRWCSDPCSRYVGPPDQRAGFVVGGNRLAAVAPNTAPRPLGDLAIYELMLDDFTAQYRGDRAPVDAVLDRLDHLQALGINTIELMPWTAWRGSAFDWGYDPILFFSVEDRYVSDPGAPADRLVRLQRLVDTLHRHGIGVIMDGVFNHVNAGRTPDAGFPYFWLYQDPTDSPFIGAYEGGGYFDDLDYHNNCTEQFVADACKYWLDTYQLDGIRFDYVTGYFDPADPEHGITRLIGDLRAHLAQQGRDHVALILEDMQDNRYQAIDDTNRTGATACWYDRVHWDVPQAARDGTADPSLVRVLDTALDFGPGAGPVTYIENHDHASVVNRVGGRGVWYRTQAPAIALTTVSGAVMLHNGQEFGSDVFMPEDGPGRVAPRPLDWNDATDPIGRTLIALYRRLLALRAEHPALRGPNFHPWPYDPAATSFDPDGFGVDRDRGIAVYHRWAALAGGAIERFVVALNFSAQAQAVDLPFPTDGRWPELLDGDDRDVTGYRAWVTLPSNWGRLYLNVGPA